MTSLLFLCHFSATWSLPMPGTSQSKRVDMLSTSGYLSSSSTHRHTWKSVPQSYLQNDYFHNNLASEVTDNVWKQYSMARKQIRSWSKFFGHGWSSLNILCSYRDCLYFNNCHQMLQDILLYFPYIVTSRWPKELNIGSVDRVHIQLSEVDNIVSDRLRGRYRDIQGG